MERAKNRQRKAANSLDVVMRAAEGAKATNVDQVHEKVDEYFEKCEKAEKVVAEAEAMERQWHEEMERNMELTQQTPTPKSEQEAQGARMQGSSEEQLAMEVESRVVEGKLKFFKVFSELAFLLSLHTALRRQKQLFDKEVAEKLAQALEEKEKQVEQELKQKVR